MDKKKLAELIRRRRDAMRNAPKLAAEPIPAPNPPRRGVCMPWPEIVCDTKRAPAWVLSPNPRPKPTPAPDRRRKGEHALTKIAAQLPAKLPRLDLPQLR